MLVPTLIDRTYEARNKRAKMTNREFLYRPAFELGRHLIGYEVQKILAGVDWFTSREPRQETEDRRLGIRRGRHARPLRRSARSAHRAPSR